jgi:hypothetical protein
VAIPLPLPRTWLTFSAEEPRETDRESILTGKTKKPGTKAFLRSLLLDAGWDPEEVDPVLAERYQPRMHLADLNSQHELDFNEALLRFKAKGFKPFIIPRGTGSCLSVQEQWDSLTRFPWWTAALRGRRGLVLSAASSMAARRASAGFIRDLWVNLGEAPVTRLPAVQRVNLLSFSSAEAITRFQDRVAPKVGVVVVHGLETADLVYQSFGYAAALSEVAPHAVLVYEAVPAPDVDERTLLSAAKRSGFSTVFGVRRG